MTPPDRLLQSAIKQADKFGVNGNVCSDDFRISRNIFAKPGRGYKTVFMLNSAEHEILTAH